MTRAQRNGIAILGSMAAFSFLGDYDPKNNLDFLVGVVVGMVVLMVAAVAYQELMSED